MPLIRTTSNALTAALLVGLHALSSPAHAAGDKAATKPAAGTPKSAAKAPVAKGKTSAKPAVDPGPAPASSEQISAAEQVYYGAHECEFNQTASIAANPHYAGYVDVKQGKTTYLMKPVLSSTGAVRLEDVKGQTLMVQIASKSMLLDVKAGRRIVDDCVSAKHREAMERRKQALLAEAAAASAAAASGIATAQAPQPLLLAGPGSAAKPPEVPPASNPAAASMATPSATAAAVSAATAAATPTTPSAPSAAPAGAGSVAAPASAASAM
jgi:hypothetical protein